MRLFHSLLKVIINPHAHDTEAVDVFRSGMWNTLGIDVLNINHALSSVNRTRREKLSFFSLISHSESLSELNLLNRAAFETAANTIIRLYEKQSVRHFYPLMKEIAETSGFLEFIENRGTAKDMEDVYKLLQTVRAWGETEADFSILDCVNRLDAHRKYAIAITNREPSEPSAQNAVKVLTAHQSKGLEYDTVFVPGLFDKNWGNRRVAEKLPLPKTLLKSAALPKEMENEEERRLFFVAITRAKRQLFLSYPKTVDNKEKIPSEFLSELPMEIREAQNRETLPYKTAEMDSRSLVKAPEEEEYAFIREFFKNYRLSATDLNKFLQDPKRFLRETVFKYPFGENESMAFGSAYHKAIEQFHLDFIKNSMKPTTHFLEQAFVKALSRATIDYGRFDDLAKRGKEGLNGWLLHTLEEKNPPKFVEYDFKPANVVSNGVPMTGRLDAVFADETVKTLTLVDYKTGAVKTENEMKGLTQDSSGDYFRQMLFYKILADGDERLISEGYKTERLRVEFVGGKNNEYRTVEFGWEEADVERVKGEMADAYAKMRNMEFWREVLGEEKD